MMLFVYGKYSSKKTVSKAYLVHFQRVRHILEFGGVVVDVLDVHCLHVKRGGMKWEKEKDE